jgi:multimeric flavodoxin WrbA
MEHSAILMFPKNLRRKVASFLKKMPDTSDIKVNISILEIDGGISSRQKGEESMKVIGIDGSPRKNGNTEKLLRKVLAGAEAAGGGTEYLKLADLAINYCLGCGSCRASGECVIQDDMDHVVESIQQSDVIVLGSPVYAWQVSGNTKVFMDRICRLLTPKYESRLNGPKKIAFVYTQGNPDASLFTPYFDYQEKVFPFLGFTLAGRVNAAGTRAKEDILTQEETLVKAESFGQNLVA